MDKRPDGASGPSSETWLGRRLFARRSVLALAVAVVVVGGASFYYKVAVEPELTATRIEFGISPNTRSLVVLVDPGRGLVHITGGQRGLSDIIVTPSTIEVLASDVSGSQIGRTRVSVPLGELDERFQALTAPRIIAALSAPVKTCVEPTPDARSVFSVLVDGLLAEGGTRLCGHGVGAASDPGTDVLVRLRAVSPTDLDVEANQLATPISEVQNGDQVRRFLEAMLA